MDKRPSSVTIPSGIVQIWYSKNGSLKKKNTLSRISRLFWRLNQSGQIEKVSQECRLTQSNASSDSVLRPVNVESQLPSLPVTLLSVYSVTGIVLSALYPLFHLIFFGPVRYAYDTDGNFGAPRRKQNAVYTVGCLSLLFYEGISLVQVPTPPPNYSAWASSQVPRLEIL